MYYIIRISETRVHEIRNKSLQSKFIRSVYYFRINWLREKTNKNNVPDVIVKPNVRQIIVLADRHTKFSILNTTKIFHAKIKINNS